MPVVRKKIGIIAIGNTLAGDDGVGAEVLNATDERWKRDQRVLFELLEGDLFAVEELLPRAERFIFLDAVAGEPPGQIVTGLDCPRGFSASFHQTDIGSVMRTLKNLQTTAPFPEWEIWGITVNPPRELCTGLSEPVRNAAQALASKLNQHLSSTLET